MAYWFSCVERKTKKGQKDMEVAKPLKKEKKQKKNSKDLAQSMKQLERRVEYAGKYSTKDSSLEK